jgi:mono/diheme cytochrome c family protein
MKLPLTALAALLAAAFNSACTAAEPLDGARLFTQRCAACHTVQKLTPGLMKEAMPQREATLRKLLERHHAPPVAERDAIVAYLIKETSK